MATRREKDLIIESELRVLQLIIATMLAQRFFDEPFPQRAADRFMELITMSISTAKLSHVPEGRRETLREAMTQFAREIGDIARAPQPYPEAAEDDA